MYDVYVMVALERLWGMSDKGSTDVGIWTRPVSGAHVASLEDSTANMRTRAVIRCTDYHFDKIKYCRRAEIAT